MAWPPAVIAQAPAFGAAVAADADAIVVGHGLAGLVATSELVAAGRKVLLLDQEPEASLGGHVLTRKTLGGLHTNLQGQVLNASGALIPGLYAAGEGGRAA